MQEAISSIPEGKIVFIYQAPETVVFLKNSNYYQYFSGTVATQSGEENLDLIKDRKDLLVLTKKDLFFSQSRLFSDYHIIREFDRYVIVSR